MDCLEVRALLGVETPERAVTTFVEQEITVDDYLNEETFLKTLEETLQHHVASLGQQFLVLRAAQVDRLAFRLHDALVPKRDAETRVIQAWTIQPQLQLRVKASSHLQVLKLSTILREVQRLRLHESPTATEEAQDSIEVEIFPSLRVIEVLKVDSRGLKNVHYFASQLRELHIEHTKVTTLSQLLAPNPNEATPWRNLVKLHMNCCELQVLDESVNLLTAVKTLDVGWNKIKRVDTDVTTKSLQVLNLCHNELYHLPRLQSLRDLRELNLAVNQISSLDGLTTLTALERLDVSHNAICDISEVEQLTRLTRLTVLIMEFNPIARRPDYRREVLFFLGEPIELDGTPWSDAEISSMKNRRMLKILKAESALWRQPSEALMYPTARNQSGLSVESPTLVLGYPPLPRAESVFPAHFVEIQNPQSMVLTKSSHLGSAAKSNRDGSDLLSRPSLTKRNSRVDRTPPETVDNYFRNQHYDIVTTASGERTNGHDQFTTSERIESDDSDTETVAQLSQPTRSLSGFLWKSEEKDLVVSIGNAVHRDDALVASQDLILNPQSLNARVLLSATEADELDLHYKVDGVPAHVEIKSHVIIEKYPVCDGNVSKFIYRRLRDVVAIGTLIHPGHAKTIAIKLRIRGSLSGVVDAAYQFDTITDLETLLSPLIARIYKQYKGLVVITNCVHCRALSFLTPKYPIRTRADDALTIYTCLLCLSFNLREISVKKLISICADEGVAISSSISLAPRLMHTITEGFSIEEPIAKDFGSMCECVMISCNGIREAAAPPSEQGGNDEALNDAIVHAMTSTMQ